MIRDDFRREYLLRLPLPIAQLYGRAYNAKSPRERHDNAFYLFEALVKLSAATSTACYLEDVSWGRITRIPLLDRLLAQLALPSLGQWLAILRELNRHFSSRVDAATHPWGTVWEKLSRTHHDCPALLALYRRVKNGPDAAAAGDRTCNSLQVLEALVQYRNAVFGHGAGRFESFFADEMGPLLFPAVNELLAEGQFPILGPDGARLVYLTDIRRMHDGRTQVALRELVGTQSERIAPLEISTEQAASLLPNRIGLLWSGRAVPLRLDPMLQYRESELSEEVLFLNRDRNGKQVEYLSYTTGRTERDRSMLPALAELLTRVTNHQVSEAELQQLTEQSISETPSVESLFASQLPELQELGEYELLSELGRGGMGVVYLARQSSLGRLVALKMLPHDLAADEVALARFRREIRNLAACDDPHVIKVLASGTFPDGRLYYTMEYVPGSDLEMVWRELSGLTGEDGAAPSSMALGNTSWTRAVLAASRKLREKAEDSRSRGSRTNPVNTEPRPAPPASAPLPLPPLPDFSAADNGPGGFIRHVVTLARDVAKALQSIHDQGIVHRDVKPANLMLTPDGQRIVLMDFGLAKTQASSLAASRQGGLLGTLRYAAPEQLAAANIKVGPAVDVRGLGVTLWELLTRKRLFGNAEDEARLTQEVLMSDVPRLRSIDSRFDRDLDAIVARATERRLADRIQSAGQLAELLQLWLDGKPLPIRLPTIGELAWRWLREHAVLATAAALLLLMALITGGVTLRGAVQRQQQSHEAWHQVQQQSQALLEQTLPDLARELRQTDVDIDKLHAVLPTMEQQAKAIRQIAEGRGLVGDEAHRALERADEVDHAVGQFKMRLAAVNRLVQARVLRFQVDEDAFRIADGMPVIFGRDARKVYRDVLIELAGGDVSAGPPTRIVESLSRHDITEHLRRALDDWFVLSYAVDEQAERERLATLAESLDAGDDKDARAVLRKAIVTHDVATILQLAEAQLKSADPTPDQYYTGLMVVDGLLENLKLDMAAEVLRKLREAGARPGHEISQFGRCWADFLCGVVLTQVGSQDELQEALRCFEAAAAIDSSLDVVRLNAAVTHWLLARPDKSVELLKTVRDPELDRIRQIQLGFALAQCGRATEARDVARQLMNLGPDSVLAFHGAALILAEVLDPESSRQAALAGLKLDPHHPALLWLAYESGSAALRQALAEVPPERLRRSWQDRIHQAMARMQQALQDQDLNRSELEREELRQLGVRDWRVSWIEYSTLFSFQNWREQDWESTLRQLRQEAPSILAEQVPNPAIAQDNSTSNQGVRQLVLREAEYARVAYPPSQFRRLLASANLLQYAEPELAALFYQAAQRSAQSLKELGYGSASSWSMIDTALTEKIRLTADPEANEDQSSTGKIIRSDYYWHVGEAALRREDFATAGKYFHKYLELVEDMASEHPEDTTARGNVSRAYAALAEVNRLDNNFDAAKQFAQQDIDNTQSIVEDVPDDPSLTLILARAHFAMATLLQSQKQVSESALHLNQAATIYRRYLENSPTDARIQDYLWNCYQTLGDQQLDSGDYQAAMVSFQRCLPLAEQRSRDVPNSLILQRNLARVHISLGRTCLFQRQPDRGMEHFQKALALLEPFAAARPDQPEVLAAVAEIYPYLAMASSQRGDLAASREYHDRHVALRRRLLALRPEDESNSLWLATALGSRNAVPDDVNSSSFEDAERQLQELDEALRLTPNDAASWFQRGNVLYWMNELDRAYKDFSEAIRLDPNNAWYFYARGETSYWLDDAERAVQDHAEAIRLDPKQSDFFHSRGIVLGYLERFDEALVDFDTALKLNASDPAIWASRAIVLARLGRFEQSEADFSQAFSLSPHDASLFRQRGYTRELSSRPADAERDYNQAIELEPDDPENWRSRVSFNQQQHRWSEAAADIEQLLKLTPDDAEMLNSAGIFRLQIGDVEGAKQKFLSAMEKEPQHFSAHRHLALALAAERRWDDARHEYDACIAERLCFPASWVEAAVLAKMQGNDDEARQLRDSLLSRFWENPNPADADAVAWASARFADPEHRPAWEKFLSQWGGDQKVLTSRTQAAIHYRLEHWPAAESAARQWIAVAENSADPRALLFLTMSLARQQKSDEARQTLALARSALRKFEKAGSKYTSPDGRIKWVTVEESRLLLAEAEREVTGPGNP